MGRTTFDDFIAEVEAEARAEGSHAVAELEVLRRHISLLGRRSRVVNAYRERRDQGEAGMREIMDVQNEAAGGWAR